MTFPLSAALLLLIVLPVFVTGQWYDKLTDKNCETGRFSVKVNWQIRRYRLDIIVSHLYIYIYIYINLSFVFTQDLFKYSVLRQTAETVF